MLLGAPAPVAGPAAADDLAQGYIEIFDGRGPGDRWSRANFDRKGPFATGWRRRLVEPGGDDGMVLRLRPAPKDAVKPYHGAEIQRRGLHHFGRYEIIMRAARGDGLVSAFFTYTGPYFGDPHDEIDFEFLGRDTTKVWLNLFADGDRLPGRWVPLGFDAADGLHLYTFDWTEDEIVWTADGAVLLRVTADEHPLPDDPGRLFVNIWAGNARMNDWLAPPGADARGEAQVYCISYRPTGVPGRGCSDVQPGAWR